MLLDLGPSVCNSLFNMGALLTVPKISGWRLIGIGQSICDTNSLDDTVRLPCINLMWKLDFG